MKSTLAIVFSAALALAAPSVPAPDAFPYRLKITSANEKFNGKYLSTNGSFVGIFRTGASKPLEVYAVSSSNGLVEFRTYPETANSQSIVLLGEEDSDLTLTTLKNPAATSFPRGTTCDWTSFKLGSGNPPAAGRGDNLVTYARAKTGDKFGLYDYGAAQATAVQLHRGEGFMRITTAFPVNITYEAINTDEYTIM